MNRSVISRCRSWSTTWRGRRASTCERARWTSWRTAAGLRSSASATSGAAMPNTSVSTNAARSSGLSDSSTISIAMDTSSASWAAAAPSALGSGSVATGSGSHGPDVALPRVASVRSRLSASRVVIVSR